LTSSSSLERVLRVLRRSRGATLVATQSETKKQQQSNRKIEPIFELGRQLIFRVAFRCLEFCNLNK